MSGNIDLAEYWPDADVYVGAIDAADPADVDTDFGIDWDLVGILDGEAGIGESRDENVNEVFGWGVGLIVTTRKNFIMTKSFTALEYNDVTRALIYPGSDAGEIVVPRPAKLKVGFETRGLDSAGDPTKRRLITANYAEISFDGDRSEVEDDITRNPFMVKIYPDASVSPALLFVEQSTGTGS